MSRYLIQPAKHFVLNMPYQVVDSDINEADHLAAIRVLPITELAQRLFTKNFGDAMGGAGLIMVNSQIDYISEAYLGDTLILQLAVENQTEKSFEFVYRICNEASGAEVARASTRNLFFDYLQRQVVPLPPTFKALVTQMHDAYRAPPC